MAQKSDLRNIGIVAHVDAGKTTVSENMLYLSGGIRSLGSVDRGTASMDWLDIANGLCYLYISANSIFIISTSLLLLYI